jgi:hypothetical protein
MAKSSLAEHSPDAELVEQTQSAAEGSRVPDESGRRAPPKPRPEQEADVPPPASSRETLIDFFDDVFTSSAAFLIHDTGY